MIAPETCACGHDRAEHYSQSVCCASCSCKGFRLAPPLDLINHPPHYTSHPSGVECIQVTEHMGFNLGNAVKYIWRADLKGDVIEDLRKAAWYVQREIERREAAQ